MRGPPKPETLNPHVLAVRAMPWSELVLGAPHTTVFFIPLRVLLVACARGDGRTSRGRERQEEEGSERKRQGAGRSGREYVA